MTYGLASLFGCLMVQPPTHTLVTSVSCPQMASHLEAAFLTAPLPHCRLGDAPRRQLGLDGAVTHTWEILEEA